MHVDDRDLGRTVHAQWKPRAHSVGHVKARLVAFILSRRKTLGKHQVVLSIASTRELTAVGMSREGQRNSPRMRRYKRLWVVRKKQIRTTRAAAPQSSLTMIDGLAPIDSRDEESIVAARAQRDVHERNESRIARTADDGAWMIEVIMIAQHDEHAQRRAQQPEALEELRRFACGEINEITGDRDEIGVDRAHRVDRLHQSFVA